MAISGEGAEDLLGGLGPHKRPRVVIPGVDPGADVGLQGVDAGMDTPLQQLGGELGEPALNLIEPRGANECPMCGFLISIYR